MKIGFLKTDQQTDLESTKLTAMLETGVSQMLHQVAAPEDPQHSIMTIINTLKSGDVLVVQTLEDLGETGTEIMGLVQLLQEKEIGLQIMDCRLTDPSEEQPFMFRDHLFQIMNCIEKKEQKKFKLIEKSTAQKGPGRPKKYSKCSKNPEDREKYQLAVEMIENKVPLQRIAALLNISRRTVYTIKSEYERNELEEKVGE